MTTKNQLENFFLFYIIEGKRLLSGNIWGTKPGRNFSFDLETHNFFDYRNSNHSGCGIKKLFEVRGEKLPEIFRINYNRFKQDAQERKDLIKTTKKSIYLRGPLEVIPPQMTPPNKLSFWDSKGSRILLPAEVFCYTDFLSHKVGYILKAKGEKSETLIRPLSVWERLVGQEKTIFSYRQKPFLPFLYKADALASAPEKVIIVTEGEERVDQAFCKIPKDFPAHFTTWPYGGDSMLFYPSIYECLKSKEVLLWPINKESKERMILLKKTHLPRARIINTDLFGIKENINIIECVQFLIFLKNVVYQPDAYTIK